MGDLPRALDALRVVGSMKVSWTIRRIILTWMEGVAWQEVAERLTTCPCRAVGAHVACTSCAHWMIRCLNATDNFKIKRAING